MLLRSAFRRFYTGLANNKLAGVVGAIWISSILMAAANLLGNLPRAALAGVMIASAIAEAMSSYFKAYLDDWVDWEDQA